MTAWWLHQRPRPEMRATLQRLERFIATPNTAKYRLFVWVGRETLPHNVLIAIARNDDYFFGVLYSSVHEFWARGLGTQLREVESGFRYTPTTCFEAFPFPECYDEAKEDIARAARSLNERSNGWLNPLGLSETDLKKRTLTNLYNQCLEWLAQAHEQLDRMVHAAYDWEYPFDSASVLDRLLELNVGRAT